ncbi:hypothetical protein VTP01DRAFT_3313 [Rhizomucor pusillus]|uniref:uncharacterized protein n=1 Tax=Rhizomucor pusillus TaxID=4840 RepID=UPI003743276D
MCYLDEWPLNTKYKTIEAASQSRSIPSFASASSCLSRPPPLAALDSVSFSRLALALLSATLFSRLLKFAILLCPISLIKHRYINSSAGEYITVISNFNQHD